MIYNASLLILIFVTTWAMFTPKVTDKIGIIAALVMVAFSALAMLAQSTVGWRVTENANQVFVIGASIFALRCFYIKSGMKRNCKNLICGCRGGSDCIGTDGA